MNNRTANWLLFFINPLISILFSLRDYSNVYSKNIFWFFCTFYGLTFAISSETGNSDIVRYIGDLKYFYSLHQFTLKDLLVYYTLSGEVDFVNLIVTFFVSRFTDNGAILTMVYGFIFGYFYSRNIWSIFNILNKKLTIIEKLLLFAIVLIVPIWNINGFRMYLAFHVFMYGLLPFILKGKKSKLIFIFISFTIHFSYSLPIGVFLIHYLFGNKVKIYFTIFIISTFISELDIIVLNNFIENIAPKFLIDRTANYRSQLTVESYRESLEISKVNWYIIWFEKMLRWGLTFCLVFFFFSQKRKFKGIKIWNNLFSISLLFFSVANLFSSFPSGSRFYIFSSFLVLVMILYYSINIKNDIKFDFMLRLLIPVLVLFIIVSLRISMYTTSITTVFGNPIIAIFSVDNNLPLNDLIK